MINKEELRRGFQDNQPVSFPMKGIPWAAVCIEIIRQSNAFQEEERPGEAGRAGNLSLEIRLREVRRDRRLPLPLLLLSPEILFRLHFRGHFLRRGGGGCSIPLGP